jgi:hypothetical protein
MSVAVDSFKGLSSPAVEGTGGLSFGSWKTAAVADEEDLWISDFTIHKTAVSNT